jgi:hypothetical protein
MAVECTRCKTENPDGSKFCRECGNSLAPETNTFKEFLNSTLRDQVREIFNQSYSDQKVVEIETTQAIANRLLDWAKLLAFFIGIPIALLLLILGVLGIKTYNDFSTQIDKAMADAAAKLTSVQERAAKLQSESDSLASVFQKLRTQASDTTALAEQVKTLSAKVNVIELRLEDAFAGFQDYVKSLGYRSGAGTFDVDVREKMPAGKPAYYDPDRRKLVVGREYVTDVIILYRAYMLQVLSSSGPDISLLDYSAIYSGLATYFSCSFVDNPRPNPDTTIWDLAKKRPFTELKPTDDSVLIDGTEIWGSAFWELRTILGKNVADKILIDAWFNLHAEKVRADRGASFVRKLFDLDKTHEAQIRAVFVQRGLSL